MSGVAKSFKNAMSKVGKATARVGRSLSKKPMTAGALGAGAFFVGSSISDTANGENPLDPRNLFTKIPGFSAVADVLGGMGTVVGYVIALLIAVLLLFIFVKTLRLFRTRQTRRAA